ncbi:MAG: hypothetical protein KJP07_20195 [Desulfatitalea sp.]|nr:hypothetical protein [Desulfatitalea sp.]
MPAFNHRIRPRERFGIPAAVFDFGSAAVILIIFALFPIPAFQIVCIALSIICLIIAAYGGIHHKDALMLRAQWMNKRESKCYSVESLIEK